MIPLSSKEVEQKLARLELQVAELENRDARAAMQLVLTYLEERRRALGQERAGIERTIDQIRAELG